jgi:hypothetical protein
MDPDEQVENNELVAVRLAQFGVEDLSLAPSDDLALVLRVAVEMTDGLLRLAFRGDPKGDPALIAEAESALRSYLSDRLG